MEVFCVVIGISLLPTTIIFAWHRRKQRKLREEMTLRGEEVDQEDHEWLEKRAALVFVGLVIVIAIILPNLSEAREVYIGSRWPSFWQSQPWHREEDRTTSGLFAIVE